MKMHIVSKEFEGKSYLVQQYYCRRWKVWVAYKIDSEGNQIAPCDYDIDKGGSAYLACAQKNYQ